MIRCAVDEVQLFDFETKKVTISKMVSNGQANGYVSQASLKVGFSSRNGNVSVSNIDEHMIDPNIPQQLPRILK